MEEFKAVLKSKQLDRSDVIKNNSDVTVILDDIADLEKKDLDNLVVLGT